MYNSSNEIIRLMALQNEGIPIDGVRRLPDLETICVTIEPSTHGSESIPQWASSYEVSQYSLPSRMT